MGLSESMGCPLGQDWVEKPVVEDLFPVSLLRLVWLSKLVQEQVGLPGLERLARSLRVPVHLHLQGEQSLAQLYL